MTHAAFACVTLVLVGTAGVTARGEETPPPKVTVAAPVEQMVTSYLEATGKTAAVNSVDLVARVQGFLQEISYSVFFFFFFFFFFFCSRNVLQRKPTCSQHKRTKRRPRSISATPR